MSSISTTEAAPEAQAPSWRTWPVLALCLPGALLVVATAAMLAGLLFGVDPLWHVEPLTLPEAAALRDNGEVVRLIDLGEDPNRAGPVRPDILRNDSLVLTPLEAAVGARRADMVDLLFESGAVVNAATWTRLICFAGRVDAGDVKDVLDARRPAGASDACDEIQTPW